MSSKSVLVTGANSGIGLVTALELAGAGYDVVGSVRSPAKAELVEAAAAERGVTVRTVELDVDDAASCAAGVEQVAALTGGGPWALVNNAAAFNRQPFLDVSVTEFDRVWAANVRGLFYLSQCVARAMAGRRLLARTRPDRCAAPRHPGQRGRS